MNSFFLQQVQLYHGAHLALPDGFIARGVFDRMGSHTLHVEAMSTSLRPYVIHAMLSGAVPYGALYLGGVVESHGQWVTHYYAVPQ